LSGVLAIRPTFINLRNSTKTVSDNFPRSNQKSQTKLYLNCVNWCWLSQVYSAARWWQCCSRQ